jgi:Leucine-rich repeat (LRR) protein
MGLTRVPKDVLNLTALKSLSLTDNAIAELPDAVSRLTCLTEWMLSDNMLRTFPTVILPYEPQDSVGCIQRPSAHSIRHMPPVWLN